MAPTLKASFDGSAAATSVDIGPCRHKPVPEQCAACILDTSDYFRRLRLPAKQALQQRMRLHRFERHQMLHAEGQHSERVCILMRGEVKVFRSLPDGRHQIHKLAVMPGDVIGCEDLFLGTYGSSAQALTPVTVCALDRQELLAAIAHHPELGIVFLQTMARDLNSYIRHIASLGQKQALERLAAYLMFMLETHVPPTGDEMHVSQALSRNELAELLGMTPRTLIRGLRALEHKGIIAVARSGFLIRNLPRLSSLATGEGSAGCAAGQSAPMRR
jgi:CRP/FNR family transcriptional regulator